MFSFENEIVDITILNEGFNLPKLFFLRENLIEKINKLDSRREKYIELRDAFALQKIQNKINTLETNILLVEEVIVAKENNVFEFLVFCEFCLN